MNASALRPAGRDVVAVFLADQLEFGLGVNEPEHVAVSEVFARGQPAAEMQQRGPLHQRVVDVEECGRGQIDRRLRRAVGGCGRGLGVQVVERPFGAGVPAQRLEVDTARGCVAWITGTHRQPPFAAPACSRYNPIWPARTRGRALLAATLVACAVTE
ncbi:hypothetical protein MYXE_42120 [Mycobacterium xenopi]|uniref:Uncharacterized protein n=1 Tax=Mycobacterium xenopi TaxID=1789 RepID=A0AAD1H4W3_MYCXE|nr:hypothetical protein MYXE_42120 [Mycobacterium xenopi]